MPIYSFSFDKDLGAIINVFVAPASKKRDGDIPNVSSQGDVVRVGALIDTGASHTAISGTIAEKMKLKPSGLESMVGATGTASVYTYFLDIIIPMGNSQHIYKKQITECNIPSEFEYQLLLGRDILCSGFFQMNFDGSAILAF